MVLAGNNVIREDVFREELDEKLAPSLGGIVLGSEPEIYREPEKFFSITLVTEQVAEIVANIAKVLTSGEGTKVILLSAYFGGGKTHTLISLFHALKNPRALERAVVENQRARELINRAVESLAGISKSIDIVVIDGHTEALAPTPVKPLEVGSYRVQTLWGYLAHSLGSYSSLRAHDEKMAVPGVDTLVSLFSNRRIIILIDEIAAYVKSLYVSADQGLKGYASAISTFMERLAKAVEASQNIVLVVSLPMAVSGEEVKGVEKGYEVVRDILKSIVKALARVSSRYIEPVTPRNIPALLRTRLFSSIDGSRREHVRNSLLSAYQNGEVFDKNLARRVSMEVDETYPFHPLYIDTLIDILDKHEKLQKTRDLLRISRLVLRSIVRDRDYYELVMPWHIDLSNPGMSTYLLSGYEGFKIVVESDVKERTKSYEKPYLAELVSKTLLARTFVYGGVLTPRVEVFPDPYELAVMVYEPYTFQARGLLEKDIIDAIEWVKRNLIYVLEDERTKRLWFTQYITPIKYIEERAQRVPLSDAVTEIVDTARELLVKSTKANSSRKAKGAKKAEGAEVPEVFDTQLSTVSYTCDGLDYDTQKYIVYACIDVPDDMGRKKSLLEEIIYYTKSGGLRRYANTVFVTYPSRKDKFQTALEHIKRVIAYKEIEREKVIEDLAKTYGGEADIVKEVFKNKAKSYYLEEYGKALASILHMFDAIAYPGFSDKEGNTVIETYTQFDETIIGSVESTLKNIHPSKFVTSMDFDTLAYYLGWLGVDLKRADMVKNVGEIIEYFYTNPRLPITTIDTVKEAIKDGVKNLEIGLRCGDRVYYKVVYECSSESECLGVSMAEGETLTNISDNCQVLPWSTALIEQMKALRKSYEVVGGVAKVIEYFINYDGELKKVEDVLADISRYDLETLKRTALLRLERKVPIIVKPDSVQVVSIPGEVIERVFTIERIGPFTGNIVVEADKGSVEPREITIDDTRNRAEVTWRFKAPDTEGSLNISLRVKGSDGLELSSSNISVRVEREKANRIKGLPQPGTRFREMVVEINQPNLKPLKILSTRFNALTIAGGSLELSFKRGVRESRVYLEVRDISIDEMINIALKLLEMSSPGEVKLRISLRLVARDYYEMPSLSENELKELQPFVYEVSLE